MALVKVKLPWQIVLPALIIRAAAKVAKAVLGAVLALVAVSTVGRARRAALPAWIAAVAAVTLTVPDSEWLWLTVTAALTATAHLTDHYGRTRVLSVREQWIWQRAAGAITLWHAASPWITWRWATATLLGICVTAGVPWWRNNLRVLATEKAVSGQAAAWQERIADSDHASHELRGSTLVVESVTDDVTTGRVVACPGAKGSTLATLDEHVESLLGLTRGTVTIGPRHGLPANEASIVFARSGVHDIIRWWEGPTLDDKGTYVVGMTATCQPVRDHIWHSTGGSFGSVLSGPRMGKGVKMRLDIIEAGLSPDVYTLVIDGKYGAGLPETRDAADLYVGLQGPDAWSAVVDAFYGIYVQRATRYGDRGWSRWTPKRPDPLFCLYIDESLNVFQELSQARIANLQKVAGGGSSCGMRFVIDSQRGDAESFGTTKIRNNLRAAGTVWIGPAGDAISSKIASQDYGCDPNSLPPARGWAWMASRFHGLAPTQIRTLYLPSQLEVDDDGVGHPFGTAEEWAARAVHPQLVDDDQAVIDIARQVIDDLGRAPSAQAERPSLSVVQPQAEDGTAKVLRALSEANAPLQRGEIANRAGVVPRHVTDILNKLEGAKKVVRAKEGWEIAS